MKIKRFLRKFDWYNWIRYRTWERHHVLKMQYLNPGWHDMDEVIVHAMFQTLCDFIEKEKPWETVNWRSDEHHSKAWDEMMYLYSWWKYRCLKRDDENPLFKDGVVSPEMKFTPTGEKHFNPVTKKEEEFSRMDFVHKSKEDEEKWNKACKESSEWEDKCNKEDEEMMIRLIKVRGYMWI